jgi:hypothetical protein
MSNRTLPFEITNKTHCSDDFKQKLPDNFYNSNKYHRNHSGKNTAAGKQTTDTVSIIKHKSELGWLNKHEN